MSDTNTLQWAIGILVSIDIVVTGFVATQLWAHIKQCGLVIDRLSGVAKDVERMKEDIGTHDTGMRGELHKHGSLLTAYGLRLDTKDKR
jgi:hypothetical protein